MEYPNGTRVTHLEEDSNGNITDPGYDNLRRVTLKRWEDDSGTLGNGTRVVGFQHLQDQDGDGNMNDPGYDRINDKLLEEKNGDRLRRSQMPRFGARIQKLMHRRSVGRCRPRHPLMMPLSSVSS